MTRFARTLAVIFAVSAALRADGDLRFAKLGDFELVSGRVIENCLVGYRTFGALNADRSNAVLFPTWFSGQTQDLKAFISPEGMVDSSQFFVIAVDALGNSISSSPSNSRVQGGRDFPAIAVADMARSQRRLLREEFGIERLHAVVGISMGGMQAFEWIVAYPDAVRLAAPIIGSPRLGAYDLLLWRTQLLAIEQAFADYADPARARRAAMRVVAGIHELALRTPGGFNRLTPRAELDAYLARQQAARVGGLGPLDWAAQLRAMIGHDVTRAFGGSLEEAMRAVQAELLVVVAASDQMVTPGPALAAAELLGAEKLVLESDCGHLAFQCESETVAAAVRGFLGGAAR